MDWIDPIAHKPEGKVFWALTEGKDEQGESDWVICKLWNCELGDYRSLDYAQGFKIGDKAHSWDCKIYAWLPIDQLVIPEIRKKNRVKNIR